MNESIVVAIIALMEKLEQLPLSYDKATKASRAVIDAQSDKCRTALMRLNVRFPAEYKVAYVKFNEGAVWRRIIRMP